MEKVPLFGGLTPICPRGAPPEEAPRQQDTDARGRERSQRADHSGAGAGTDPSAHAMYQGSLPPALLLGADSKVAEHVFQRD